MTDDGADNEACTFSYSITESSHLLYTTTRKHSHRYGDGQNRKLHGGPQNITRNRIVQNYD